ncbi:MAG: T9SS type A sorting domain-containing protein [Bacteroidia bacterium]
MTHLIKNRMLYLTTTVFILFTAELSAQWNPAIVSLESNGALSYVRDTSGNVIPDFSYAGYMGGGVPIPDILTKLSISAIAGDNTAHIQAIIDQAAQLPADSLGFRGAIYLAPGRYEIHGTLYFNQSGVVLRGAGDGEDTLLHTVLVGIGNTPNQRSLLVMGGGSATAWAGKIAGTQTNIITDKVLVGESVFKIENPAPYAVGDNIVIYHPCTQAWIDAVGGGGTATGANWSTGSQPLVFNRRIVDIKDSTITVDVPIYNHLDRSLSQAYIYKYDRAGLRSQLGLEDIRIDITTAGGTDEAHAWNAVSMKQIEDAWVKNCTFLHFGLSGVITETASRITVENCRALDPVATVTGGNMYNFNVSKASSQILFTNCHASNGRHHYVSNGTSWVSGCVFHRCTSEAAYASSEGHRRWSMGLLYDNHTEIAVRNSGLRLLALYNRGDYGTSHGWAAVHSVAWNCDVKTGQLVVEKPPTAQNYAIGCRGTILGTGPFNQLSGYREGSNVPGLEPGSLYEAQLYARLNGLKPEIINTGPEFKEDTDLLLFDIFPNPANEVLHIRYRSPYGRFENTEVILLDINGRKLETADFSQQITLDITLLNPGVYLLLLRQGERQITRRIKIQ